MHSFANTRIIYARGYPQKITACHIGDAKLLTHANTHIAGFQNYDSVTHRTWGSRVEEILANVRKVSRPYTNSRDSLHNATLTFLIATMSTQQTSFIYDHALVDAAPLVPQPYLTDQEVWDSLADILALDVCGISLFYYSLL